ncbi:MAG: HAMP domain-containing protein [Anaerolineales bacterium]|nr:HAMP domain-containing protein [Anaerolineales bacterium]
MPYPGGIRLEYFKEIMMESIGMPQTIVNIFHPVVRGWNNLLLRTKILIFGLSGMIILSVGFVLILNSAIQKTNQTILDERLALAVVLSNQLDVNIHFFEQTFLQGIETLLDTSTSTTSVDFTISGIKEYYRILESDFSQVIWVNNFDNSLIEYPTVLSSNLSISDTDMTNRVSLHASSRMFVIHPQNSSSLYIGIPILDSSELENGVLLAKIPSQKFFNKIQDDLLKNREDINVDIVDIEGSIILTTNPDRYLKTIRTPGNISELINSGMSSIEACVDCQNSAEGDYIEINQMVFSPLSHANWGIIISEQDANSFGKFQTPLGQLLIYSLVVFIIIILLAAFFATSLISPLGDLSRNVNRIANQNLDDQIAFSRNDELGLLAQSIDQMRSSIKSDLSKAQHEIDTLASDLQVVIDSLADDMVIIDRDFRVQLANASARENYLGEVPIIGQLCWNISHAGIPCEETGCECPVRQVFKNGVPSRVIHVHSNSKKNSRFVEIIASPIKNASGEIRGAVELIRDVSDEKWKEEQRKRLLKKVISAQEEERERIARDLHDEIGQAITAIIMRCGALEQSSNGDKKIKNNLGKIRSTASATMQNLRSIMLDLRPDLLHELGLKMAIRALIKERLIPAGIDCSFESTRLNSRFSPLIEITSYRVIQEAITNILKHSQASEATISLCLNSDSLFISIADNGLGFDQAQTYDQADTNGMGMGLRSMIERISILNGDLEINSAPNAGTHIIANIPMEKHHEPN